MTMPVLRVSELTKDCGGLRAVDGVSFHVDEGEFVGLIGPNGCGKTSLLASLTGYKFPTSGDIYILGNTFGENDWTELRTHIGLVSSTLNKLMAEDEPVMETVVSGKYAMIDLWHDPSAADIRTARAILKRIECLHLANRPWAQLSQGERQRALIGRALMAKPKLLMLDEPCAGLDPVAREHFLQFLDRLGQQRNSPSIILITHHTEEIMPVFTHALLIRDGRNVAQGPVKEILNDEALSRVFEFPVQLSRKQGRYWLTTKTKRNSVM